MPVYLVQVLRVTTFGIFRKRDIVMSNNIFAIFIMALGFCMAVFNKKAANQMIDVHHKLFGMKYNLKICRVMYTIVGLIFIVFGSLVIFGFGFS